MAESVSRPQSTTKTLETQRAQCPEVRMLHHMGGVRSPQIDDKAPIDLSYPPLQYYLQPQIILNLHSKT